MSELIFKKNIDQSVLKAGLTVPKESEVLRPAIARFLNDYIEAKSQPFTGSPFGTFVRSDIPNIMSVISKIRGGTQKFISLGDIRKLEVCLPPMELQEQFAAFVKQLDKSKVAVQKALAKEQLLFDSLMQVYFG